MNFIGIDLGGTKIEGALLDQDHTILERRRVPTPRDYDGIVRAIGHMVDIMRRGDCTLGVGAPGTTAPDGLIANSNTRAIRGMPLLRDLREATGMNIRMGNDADCFTAAEAGAGAGGGHVRSSGGARLASVGCREGGPGAFAARSASVAFRSTSRPGSSTTTP